MPWALTEIEPPTLKMSVDCMARTAKRGCNAIWMSCQVAPGCCEVVLEARRALGVRLAGDETGALEAFQALGQDVGGDVLGREEEIAEAGFTGEEVADDEQRPAIAEDVERAGDGAARSPGPALRCAPRGVRAGIGGVGTWPRRHQ